MFNTNGIHAAAHNVDGRVLPTVYDIYGRETSGKILLYEDFTNIDTNIWNFKTGAYRDWLYLPEDHSQNAYTENGKLVIRNLKNNPAPGYEWSGAYMDTKGKFSFRKGSVTARIKFSDADVFHATLWMLGESFRGEIDIAECSSGNIVAPAVVYFDREGNLRQRYFGNFPVNAREWNVYQFDWTGEVISFRCNGKLQGTPFKVADATIDGYNSLNQNYYLVINANPCTPGEIPQYFDGNEIKNYVDYIIVSGFE